MMALSDPKLHDFWSSLNAAAGVILLCLFAAAVIAGAGALWWMILQVSEHHRDMPLWRRRKRDRNGRRQP